MTYRVVRFFRDLQDNQFAYNTGDTFPREGMTVSESRLQELLSDKNKQNRPLIEAVEDEAEVESVESEKKVYTEDELENMTTKEIKVLASECGYRITKNAKFDVIAQFLKQQETR